MKEINAMGLDCPRPVILAKKAIREENPAELLVFVDNKIATENLSKMAEQLGFIAEIEEESKQKYNVKLYKKGEAVEKEIQNETGGKYIVVISSDKLGTGEEKFSKTLLEGFIYALSEQDTVPTYVIFYNHGVFLTTENEKTVSDLKNLEEKGAQILSCGLCLDNYNLKEKLKVGKATNMYRICELQIQYKTVKPC